MPELNIAYSSLFSNKGASFYSKAVTEDGLTEQKLVTDYLQSHIKAIPLTIMKDRKGRLSSFYLADKQQHLDSENKINKENNLSVVINNNYEIKDKQVIILGHNSKSATIMMAFSAFCEEWKKKDGTNPLSITIIDNEENLVKHDYYKQYAFVNRIVTADIYDKDLICETIEEFITNNKDEKCILILSDDTATDEDVDMNTITYLILVQNIIQKQIEKDANYDLTKLDMVVEILNTRNFDIVNQYSTNNIVISNRYISKMIMQLGEKESLFDFYHDILTFDDPDEEDADSKELYIRKVSEYLMEIPRPCNAGKLIRAIYEASPEDNKAIVLGFIKPDDSMILFAGNQYDIQVTLSQEDKLIIFSNH